MAAARSPTEITLAISAVERPAKNLRATSSRSRSRELLHRLAQRGAAHGDLGLLLGGCGLGHGLAGHLDVALAAAKLVQRGVPRNPEEPRPHRPPRAGLNDDERL